MVLRHLLPRLLQGNSEFCDHYIIAYFTVTETFVSDLRRTRNYHKSSENPCILPQGLCELYKWKWFSLTNNNRWKRNGHS